MCLGHKESDPGSAFFKVRTIPTTVLVSEGFCGVFHVVLEEETSWISHGVIFRSELCMFVRKRDPGEFKQPQVKAMSSH